jgi:hypothetical protein
MPVPLKPFDSVSAGSVTGRFFLADCLDVFGHWTATAST